MEVTTAFGMLFPAICAIICLLSVLYGVLLVVRAAREAEEVLDAVLAGPELELPENTALQEAVTALREEKAAAAKARLVYVEATDDYRTEEHF